jgi:hypothetical protein
MGFKYEPRLTKITFPEGDELHGLELRVKSVPLGKFFEIAKMRDNMEESAEEVFGLFSSSIVDWNLEDDEGNKVPSNVEGILDLDSNFSLKLLDFWMRAIVTVPAPLLNSSNGGKSTEDLGGLPMEIL